MKINFLNGNLVVRENKSGVHFFHENIIRELINLNIDFKISLFNFNNKFKKFLNHPNNYWIRDRIVECRNLPRVFVYFLPIEFFFGKSDIYICDGYIPHTIYKSKKIAIVHDLMSKIYPENYKPLMKLYLYIFFKQLKRADIIIAVSQTTKDDIIRYLNIPEEKIKIIYNGIDSNSIMNKLGSLDGDYLELDLNRKYLLYIGEMRKNKNLLSAIQGFEKYYRETKEDIYFYIGGKKAYEYNHLKDYIEENSLTDRVIFLGYISDEMKFKLYRNAFAFIFVSFYEGFGVPILEAMACETPVITSNCSSMKEIATGSAITIKPDNIDEIKNAISDLSDCNIRQYYVEKGKKCVKNYTWLNSAQKFNEIFSDIKGGII